MTRAMHALLNGELLKAVNFNPCFSYFYHFFIYGNSADKKFNKNRKNNEYKNKLSANEINIVNCDFILGIEKYKLLSIYIFRC